MGYIFGDSVLTIAAEESPNSHTSIFLSSNVGRSSTG
jgi:hypothetical protein